MQIKFNLAETGEYSGSTPPVPAGRYLVEIVDEKYGPTKSGKGNALELRYSILQGEKRGYLIREWINVDHSTESAREIAQTQLKSLGIACGKPVYKDTTELFRIPFYLDVIVEEVGGKERNTVKGYAPYGGNAASQGAPPPQYQAQVQAPPSQYQTQGQGAPPQYQAQPTQSQTPPTQGASGAWWKQ